MTHRPLTAALATLCLVLAAAFLLDVLSPAAAFAATSLSEVATSVFGLSPGELFASVALGGFTVAELKQKRAKLIEEMEALSKGDLTDETRSAFDAKEAELTKVNEDLRRAETMENARRSVAVSVAPQGTEAGGQGAGDPVEQRAALLPLAAQPAPQRNLGEEFGGFVRSYAMSQYSIRSGTGFLTAAEAAKELYGERHPVTENVARAQTMSDNASGGLAVVPTYAAEIIKLFGPSTIVRRRAQVVPGNADYLKGKTGAAVGYVGENEQGQATGVTWGMLSMREKDISAILPISKKLLRNTAFGVEVYCRDELIRAAAEFEDRMFLYGTGTGKQVKGYAFAIPDAHRFSAVNKTAPTNAEVRADLRKLLKVVANANVPKAGNNPGWFMHESVLLYLQDLYQGDNKAFPTLEGENPTLYGYPVDTTTQITAPEGDGGEIFFGAHRFAMIGDTVTMTLSTSDQASFKDAGGNQVNLWAQGMLGIKLDMSHDFALRHEQAFALLNAVKWGG
ncbi:phage major capsid protein [Azospirillum sp.]|uniref:phage major capsid protein n=1 Tax=Azospirillum sp. TaxID=34012 RepID=UPI003D72D326